LGGWRLALRPGARGGAISAQLTEIDVPVSWQRCYSLQHHGQSWA